MGPRERLIEAGLRLLEEAGPEALQARKLAAEIGMSTMAVYTHFGGMAGLFEALVREAFDQLAARERDVPRTDDPVADLLALGLAYRDYALANPQRYRLMFGVTAPGVGTSLLPDGGPVGAESDDSFAQIVEAVRRSMDAGRIRRDEPVAVAAQVWSLVHGYVLLEIAGVFGRAEEGFGTVLAPLTVNVLVGLGDDRTAVERSAVSVVQGPLGGC
ncbi:TetR family transcriptional regulator [Herbihabitans rhizosphaerae]|uniref:TetR family transcriptional regulator n=1 Tax=Herbihabitans rhizosphaerae TaxID=1872711 RepID=A0A4Q7KKL3_9PSEU|nr:TetR/AcrR family transcriptional regulator [Herbihabitans rhizosphaerae]RZS37015.1 TetR family transcriptional regulator [Herbihabitans rhizosphaerae]